MNMPILEFSSEFLSLPYQIQNQFVIIICQYHLNRCIFTELFKSKMEFPGQYLFDVPPEKLCAGNIECMYFCHS